MLLARNLTSDGQRRRRIIIADDHAIVREGLSVILNLCPDWEVIDEAADGEEAVAKVMQMRPDLLVLDLRMPRLDGVEVVRQCLARLPELRVLVVTTYDTDEDIYNCIQAGAQGYLLKDSPREIIIEAVRELLQGGTYTPAHVASKLLSRVSSQELSTREREVLQQMATGISNKEIGEKLFISEGTVKTHAKSINQKLDVSSRTEAVAEGRKRGYVKG